MGDARDVLGELDVGDRIKFRAPGEGPTSVEADVTELTDHGVKIDLQRDVEFLDGSRAAWIEYQPAINADYPVLIGPEGTAPDAEIRSIEVGEAGGG